MDEKPIDKSGYSRGLGEAARGMALHIATILGDLSDEIVIVGGLVPYLLIDQEQVPDRHVGTRDVDLGLSIGILTEERYREISARLRERSFRPSRTVDGNRRRQTWQLPDEQILVDFLIGPTSEGPPPGRLQNLESDFAAVVVASLPLAFVDFVLVTLEGVTPEGERARRDVRVAGPAAFVVLKAHAFRGRGANKDAYDLVYVLMNFGRDTAVEIASRFAAIADAPEARAALAILAEDFATDEHLGPRRRAAFLGDRADPGLRQDAVGAVQAFLSAVSRQVSMDGHSG